MFAIPGITTLLFLTYVRPQEFVGGLSRLPLLYIAFGLAAWGIVIDWRRNYTRMAPTPQLIWVVAFYVWCIVTAVLSAPRAAPENAIALGTSVVLYVLIAQGVQSFRGLNTIAVTLVGLTLFVAAVGVHQGFADKGCIQLDETAQRDTSAGTFDGRSCKKAVECYSGTAEPGAHYVCERVGLFGTTSAEGRVRYRGVLQDPNELALVSCIGLPLVFAWGFRRRWLTRVGLIVVSLAIVLACTVLSRSRGGQLVFAVVLGLYALWRFRLLGAFVGAVVVLPLFAFGGRQGLKAAASTDERIDCWYQALSMFRSHPLTGVGFGQFDEYHYLTAHNAYLLALAELGLPGLFLFSVIVYLCLKIPWVILRRSSARAAALPAADGGAGILLSRTWAAALLVAWSGLGIGIFFLSFTYHHMLWIYAGLSGALYAAVRRHDQELTVTLGWKDYAMIVAVDGALIVGMYLFTRAYFG